MAKIKQNEPKITIELIKNIVETALNLRQMVQENFKSKQINYLQDYDLDRDYMVLIHKYENDIRNLKNVTFYLIFAYFFLFF